MSSSSERRLVSWFGDPYPRAFVKSRSAPLSAIQGKKSMAKIKLAKPVVELDGDEMTRIMWSKLI
jgi:hypothetical protein